ncbi:MAG: glutaredoxin family protein [Betaproteobacteria bacterium]|nr:glutaredoxin family protein [Betaproteobacteria bacterium]
MIRAAILLSTAVVLSGPVLAAQKIYRWVDEKGNVEWRDTPPPVTAKKVEERRAGGGTVPAPALPYSVQQAAKNFPVTLWTTDCGDACTKARAHLARRGVPYEEKDPRNDFENFKKLTGSAEVPVLFVGSTRLKGYLEGDWDAALDTAGYPKTALVKPQPKVAPKPAPAATETPGAPAAPPQSSTVKLYTTADCGLNCTDAKQLLARRGINFQEIAVESPPQVEELKKMTGDTIVPVLHLGQFWLRGYNPEDYERALDKAGYQRPAAQ